MPHLHLSLQAGDDLILKRMKRRHSRDDAIRFCTRGPRRPARPRLRRRSDRGLPHRDRGAVRPDPRPGRGMRPDASPRLPLFAPPRHPGRADAPGGAGGDPRPRGASAGGGRCRPRPASGATRGKTLTVLAERGGTGRAEDFSTVLLGEGIAPGTIRDVRIAGHDGTRLIAEPQPSRRRPTGPPPYAPEPVPERRWAHASGRAAATGRGRGGAGRSRVARRRRSGRRGSASPIRRNGRAIGGSARHRLEFEPCPTLGPAEDAPMGQGRIARRVGLHPPRARIGGAAGQRHVDAAGLLGGPPETMAQ